MSPETLKMFQKITKGVLKGKANKDGSDASAETVIPGPEVASHIFEVNAFSEKAALDCIEKHAKADKPFFMFLNWAKNHQPNIPDTEFVHKSASKTKYADAVVEMDTRSGRVLDKLRELGIGKDILVFYTVDNGAWQDVYPDSGYTPFRGTKGTTREGGSLVLTIVWWPGTIPPMQGGTHAIAGGLDIMATFAAAAGIELPKTTARASPSTSTAST